MAKRPSNARIFIDYRNKKNPVKFQYPTNEDAYRATRKSITSFWISINGYLFILFLIFSVLANTFLGFQVYIPNKYYTYFAIYLFLTPYILSLFVYKNDKIVSLLPKLNKFSALFPFGKSRYLCVKKLNRRTLKIEYFNNIFFDYKATNEFSKYLERVEITEYKFKFITKRFWIKKKKNNDLMWKAIFYFKRIPKRGKLEVIYK